MKQKQAYHVYYVESYHDGIYGEVREHREFAGKTMAVSPEQAKNNVRFRHRGKAYALDVTEHWGDSATFKYYVAKLASEDR